MNLLSKNNIAPPTPTPSWELGPVVEALREVRARWRSAQLRNRDYGGREFPARQRLREIVELLGAALFPMRLGPLDLRQESEDFFIQQTLDSALSSLSEQIRLELSYLARQQKDTDQHALQQQAWQITQDFAQTLPALRSILDTDVAAAYHGDPAARSVDEVLLCYPGILALLHHRLAHALYQLGVPLIARMIAEIAHAQTGIDLHPAATIGNSFFIDHGTGVVIGETAVIGARVRIYQAVTLGAKHFPVRHDGSLQKGLPRHPIIEDDVVIYAGATLLGRITIGQGSIIGGNVWLTHSVPPGSQITQANLQDAKLEILALGELP